MADIRLQGFHNTILSDLPEPRCTWPKISLKTDRLEFNRKELGAVIDVYAKDRRFRFDMECFKFVILRSPALRQTITIYRPTPQAVSFLLEIKHGYITTPY